MAKVEYGTCKDVKLFSFPENGGIEIMGLRGFSTEFGWRMTEPGGNRLVGQEMDYYVARTIADCIRSDEDQGYYVAYVLISNRLIVKLFLAGVITPKDFEKVIEGKDKKEHFLILPDVEIKGKMVTLTVLPENKVGTDYLCTVNSKGYVNEETHCPVRPPYLPPQSRTFLRR